MLLKISKIHYVSSLIVEVLTFLEDIFQMSNFFFINKVLFHQKSTKFGNTYKKKQSERKGEKKSMKIDEMHEKV